MEYPLSKSNAPSKVAKTITNLLLFSTVIFRVSFLGAIGRFFILNPVVSCFLTGLCCLCGKISVKMHPKSDKGVAGRM